MGTAAKNQGPGQASSLIPSRLQSPTEDDDAPAAPTAGTADQPGSTEPEPPDEPGAAPEAENPEETPLPSLSPLPPQADPRRFQSARTHFNKSARSGLGGGGRELRRAVSEYVRKGYGGARGASGRVSHSTRAAGNVIGFAQAIRDHGFAEAVKQFSLQGLLGKPISEAAALLIDVFAGPGTTTDENITREAWCEAVKEIIEGGTTSFENLTPAQWAEAVEVFLCKAIELRIFNEIGNDAVGLAQDVAKLDQIENDLSALVRGQVQDTLVPLIEDSQVRSATELNQYINSIVDRAFDYLEALGGEED